ncbi:MAG: hypothetical protein KatS3mg121_0818 [Gammaproteobacteria bacterium]|nr:MAG: hypothetical protein KatS3mg121_0818 [Gammaproteobacteria bacterium]
MKKGYQITFFSHEDDRHRGRPVAEFLLGLCRELGLRGATARLDAEGYGRSGRWHSAHFFELADRPVEVTVAADEAQAEALFARLRAEKLALFYIKSPVEFGVVGEDD